MRKILIEGKLREVGGPTVLCIQFLDITDTLIWVTARTSLGTTDLAPLGQQVWPKSKFWQKCKKYDLPKNANLCSITTH